ncbi:MAG: pantoate--beta-alanine ligase [Desulfohalobium sp.]
MLRLGEYTHVRGTTRRWRSHRESIALVPTMGFLHQGHLRLIEWARQQCARVVVSLFVNPTQFGPEEDLAAYPVDLERDAALLDQANVDLLYAPDVREMYAPTHSTWVVEEQVGCGLCGASRPDHFRGVATVVCKLLHRVEPDIAVFGEKDWQQLAVLRRMVRDLDFAVQIVGRPIVREMDGLALSSRNTYLTASERAQAPALYAGLVVMRDAVATGQQDAAVLQRKALDLLRKRMPLGVVEYVQIVDPESLQPLETVQGPALAVAAVRLGKARLIDNLRLR